VYTEQGCAKFVVASGGEIEIQSGGTFDLQSGATVDFSGGVDLDGSTLTWDGDGDTTTAAGTDDIIATTLGAVTGTHNILTGCLKVGDGSPGLTLSEEDAYVEGTFEVDGTVRLDGVVGISNGSAGAPGLAFTSDTDSGLYRVGANNVGVAVSATLISDWSSANMDMNSLPIVNVGAAGTDFGTDGSLTTAQTVTVSSGVIVAPTGSASAPAYTFASDTDSGFYRIGANNAGVAVSATLISDWSSADMDMNNLPIVNVGAAGTDFGTNGALTLAQGLTVSAGGANVTGSIDGSADVDVGTWLNLSVQSTIAITEGSTITPTGTYQPITSTIACTTSTSTAIANGGETGDLLIVRNGNAANVIIVDGTGGNVECKTDVSLGASDTLTLIWNGSDWNCISNYDNS
jgi:hypothetical protein